MDQALRLKKAPMLGAKQRFSCFGAGALIAVGYMDPGNWATALAAGSKYGYQLLIVVLTSSLIGLLLQWVASTLGVATGQDLAQLCRARYKRRTRIFLWLTCEVAIIACDVAEIVGSAVALQLLLGVSLTVGVLMSALATILMLALTSRGQRPLQVLISVLIIFVGVCFVVELAFAQPAWRSVLSGFPPSAAFVRDAGIMWLAAGIVGATVMPHNLYLHSSLVKHLSSSGDYDSMRAAMRSVNIDTFASLGLAFVVNASLLIVAAGVFHANGLTDVSDLADAHRLISPLVGSRWASILFASALLACGLNATVTGTLAGQVVLEGFLGLKVGRSLRALITRTFTIGPALISVGYFGEHGSNQLLVASQVILTLQLPLAVIPLVSFASNHGLMGRFRLRGVWLMQAWLSVAVILLINVLLLSQVLVPG